MKTIRLISFFLLACSCESLPSLEEPIAEDDRVGITCLEELLREEGLIGYFHYPGTSDTVMRIFPTIRLAENLQTCQLFLSQPNSLGFPSVFGAFQDEILADKVIVQEDVIEVFFQPEEELPSMKISRGEDGKTTVVEYDLSGLYNLLYGRIAKSFRGEVIVVNLQDDFTQIVGKHMDLEPIDILLKEGVFYPNSYIQFEIHPNEEGTRAHAVMLVHIGEYSPESEILFGYNELDYSFNEIRSFRSELDTTSPEVVIRIYPNLEQIMMYWQAGHPYEEMMFEIRLFPDWMLLSEWDSNSF